MIEFPPNEYDFVCSFYLGKIRFWLAEREKLFHCYIEKNEGVFYNTGNNGAELLADAIEMMGFKDKVRERIFETLKEKFRESFH